MFHPNTERLIDYWRSCKGPGLAPARASIDPGAFTALLPQVFILGRTAPGLYPFRLSGGFVAGLHGRELRGQQALPLWTHTDRPLIQSALELARRGGEPVVVSAEVRARGVPPLLMEVMVAPLTGKGGEADRYIGLYQPTASIQQLDDRPAYELAVRSIAGAVDDMPRLRLAAVHGQRIA